jgi:BON domain
MKSDSELQHDARVELTREFGVDAQRIDVRVRDGVAILTGDVRSEAESWSAADAVRRVPGIQSVSNETLISREKSVPPADADVARPWFPSSWTRPSKRFPARDLTIFLATAVILLSLIFASVGLPRLLRGLALPPEATLREEEDRARDEASTAGIAAIDKARHQLPHRTDEADIYANAAARVIGFYRSRLDGAGAGDVDAEKLRKAEQVERALRLAGLRAEREKIFEMARHSRISDETSRKQVREIDLMETRHR